MRVSWDVGASQESTCLHNSVHVVKLVAYLEGGTMELISQGEVETFDDWVGLRIFYRSGDCGNFVTIQKLLKFPSNEFSPIDVYNALDHVEEVSSVAGGFVFRDREFGPSKASVRNSEEIQFVSLNFLCHFVQKLQVPWAGTVNVHYLPGFFVL